MKLYPFFDKIKQKEQNLKIVCEKFSVINEIKKSKFIVVICPFDDFKTELKNLQKAHIKATHIVWAYRYLNEFNQIVENQNDDFEPKNSAGIPCLNTLRGSELINTAIFVIRYFGGIKLGIGGIIRAYSSSANLAIKAAILKKFEIKKELKFFAPFSEISKIEYFFKMRNIEILKKFNEKGAEISAFLNETEALKFKNFSENLIIEIS